MRAYKFGWHGDQGLGEHLIQAILSGRKSASVCPAYDQTDADIQEGDEMALTDKNGAQHGVIRISRIEIRPFGRLDEPVARRTGMNLDELRQALSFAHSRDMRPDEEMRIVYFDLVSAKPPVGR